MDKPVTKKQRELQAQAYKRSSQIREELLASGGGWGDIPGHDWGFSRQSLCRRTEDPAVRAVRTLDGGTVFSRLSGDIVSRYEVWDYRTKTVSVYDAYRHVVGFDRTDSPEAVQLWLDTGEMPYREERTSDEPRWLIDWSAED